MFTFECCLLSMPEHYVFKNVHPFIKKYLILKRAHSLWAFRAALMIMNHSYWHKYNSSEKVWNTPRRTKCRGCDGWMASPTRWTWVWANSGTWWWTGRPGVLRSMGSQRVGHDWATELNWRSTKTGPEMSKYCWKNAADRYSWSRVATNLQFVKKKKKKKEKKERKEKSNIYEVKRSKVQ